MKILEIFILRQTTRPTEHEAIDILKPVLLQERDLIRAMAASLAAGLEELRFNLSNPMMPDRDVAADLDAFIISCGGQRYLDDTEQYVVRRFQRESGTPPEPTAVALVLVAQEGQEVRRGGARSWLERGHRLEQDNRWSEAAECYRAGLKKHANDPDLLLRLGAALLFLGDLSNAYHHLEMAHTLAPATAEAARRRGLCYIRIADDPKSRIKGASPEELRAFGFVLMQCAGVLDPEDAELQEELRGLRDEFGVEHPDGFFHDGDTAGKGNGR